MNVKVILLNRAGGELDRQEITVRGEEITLASLADCLGDWALADGDRILIETDEA